MSPARVMAVDHLVELGHRRIAHIDGGTGAGAEARRRGYSEAMTDHGLSAEIVTAGGDFTESGGYHAASELLSQSSRADRHLSRRTTCRRRGRCDRVEDAGLAVPDDVSIVGYDNTALAAMQHLSLTTVNQPRDELGTPGGGVRTRTAPRRAHRLGPPHGCADPGQP